jgi:cyanophycin synthetase
MPEPVPHFNTRSCPYCGDSPINHQLSYIEKVVSLFLDTYTGRVAAHAPNLLKRFASAIPFFIFRIFILLGAGRFSEDIDKAASFRSRVIWEEAIRRGIPMKQVVLFGTYLDHYCAEVNGTTIYFESIPIQEEYLIMPDNWDDKYALKQKFVEVGIPVPAYVRLSRFGLRSLEKVYAQFHGPIIVKPQIGSRGRHTVTNITTFDQFREGVRIVRQICPEVMVEEHLEGDVCRATLVGGVLGGFYVGRVPYVIGDGVHTIQELITEKDATRPDRVGVVPMSRELEDHIRRSGYTLSSTPSVGERVTLTHRLGRLFGGTTEEMIEKLHPSFVPVLERAVRALGLSVAGFDCIIPDPTRDQASQKWGIIECNTLPFIDLHYYALVGKPRNIAGMVWDLWLLT